MARQKESLFWNEIGQTLLEILLAFGVSILVLSAIILGVTTSLSNTKYTKDQGLASSYVREGMTVVRQIKNSGWTAFSSYASGTTYCLGSSSSDLIPASPPSLCKQSYLVGGMFAREIIFEHNSLNCCSDMSVNCSTGIAGSKASVTVSWTDNKCPAGAQYCHKVNLITCFSNIDQKQTP